MFSMAKFKLFGTESSSLARQAQRVAGTSGSESYSTTTNPQTPKRTGVFAGQKNG
jgi:hypothetical protein